MNKPNLTPAELARYKAMFALRRLGSTLQSDVLADGAVARESGIGISNPVHLPDGVSLDRNSLFDAFQKATDSEAIPSLKDTDGAERSLKLEIQNGNGVLSYGTNRIAFPQAALLSKKIDTRQALLTGILKDNTLTQQAAEQLNAIVSKPDYSQADFFAARKILGALRKVLRPASMKSPATKANSRKTTFFLPNHRIGRISLRLKGHPNSSPILSVASLPRNAPGVFLKIPLPPSTPFH